MLLLWFSAQLKIKQSSLLSGLLIAVMLRANVLRPGKSRVAAEVW